ncbi:MAG: HAMP domain-containing sensor histidine kinase [Ignavibacteriaceae bacterium]
MNSAVKKIVVILGIIILLPIAFFVLNEINSLNEREEVLNTIYNNQLEAILFSVNQYSEDFVSSWASHTDLLIDQLNFSDDEKSRQLLQKFYDEHVSLEMIFFVDSLNDTDINFLYPSNLINELTDSISTGTLNSIISETLINNQQLINRLYTYQRGGYRKIEPLKSELIQNHILLIFTLEQEGDTKKLCGLIIDPQTFVFRILSPKIQAVAQDEFVISVISRIDDFRFNSTKDFEVKDVQLEKPLWIIPDYVFGISLVGKTIQDLVRERAATNIMLIIILSVFLVIGVYIVYRNVKKEVELAQIKADFVSNVSHELRTPLALISMYAETLEMDRVKTEDKKKEYYQIISQETNRLGKIVNTILNFSKTEAGKRKYSFSLMDINELIEQVFNNYNFHLHNKGFEFHFKKQTDLPMVNIDPEAVSEAVINLIDNAVKYSSEKKEVTINTGSSNGYVFVEVSDKGIGIDENDQKKIFDKFYRVSTGSVHNVKGTGLGLSLVKHIVDAHNGKIELKSKLNEGSSFKILLPIFKNQ